MPPHAPPSVIPPTHQVACGWRKQFESRVDQIGDLFTRTAKDVSPYYSNLTEAYLVVMLFTLLELQQKKVGDVAEDVQTVKSRMDVCIAMQPRNPVTYKLRGDFLRRFGDAGNLDNCILDFRTAIRLADSDPTGANLNTHGLDPVKMRRWAGQ